MLRRVAVRSGVPDYGYAFEPDAASSRESLSEPLRGCGMRNVAIVGAGMTPFGEHFALGIKDLLPMAFAECAASVDKGMSTEPTSQAAWFGAMGTDRRLPVRNPRRHPRICPTCPSPARELLRHRQ